MAEILYICCPLCGMNRVLEKKGSSAMGRGMTIKPTDIKGRIRFDHMDLENANIVQVRERRPGPEEKRRMQRGGGPGFTLVEGHTLSELRDKPEYADLKEQMLSTARKIIKILEVPG